MQWEFRKALESLDTYKATHKYKSQIERNSGSNGQLLNTIVREIQLIISKYEQLLVPKVLAIRFAKDIMILGKQQVVIALQKLVPHLRGICSYQIGDANPDRGETYFHDHPFYKKKNITQQEKNEINKLGSTFLILCLESVYTWAKWIPVNQQGKESIYAQVYNSLLQAGVVFPREFHYYKPSDTEKYHYKQNRFKNTYHVEFFDESMSRNDIDNVSSASSSIVSYNRNGENNFKGRGSAQKSKRRQQNNINSMDNSSVQQFHANHQINKHQEFRSETSNQDSGTSLQVQMIRNNKQESYQKNFHDAVNYYKNYLNGLIFPQQSKGIRFDKLDSLNRKIQKLHQEHTTSNGHLINLFPNMPSEQKQLMEKDCKWLQRYILQYSLFNNKIINFKQFTEKVTAQEINIGIDANLSQVAISRSNNKDKSQKDDSNRGNIQSIRHSRMSGINLKDGVFQEERLKFDSQQRDFSKKNKIKINDVSEKESRQDYDLKRTMRKLQLQLFAQRKARQQQRADLMAEHQQRVHEIINSIRNKDKNKTEEVVFLQQQNVFLKQDREKLRVEVNHLKLLSQKLGRVVNENGDSSANQIIDEKQVKIVQLERRIREMQQTVEFEQNEAQGCRKRLQMMQNERKFHKTENVGSLQTLQRQIAQKDKRLRIAEHELQLHKSQLQKQRERNQQEGGRSNRAYTQISNYSQNQQLEKQKAEIARLKKKIRQLQKRCDDLQIEKIEFTERLRQKDKIVRKFKEQIQDQHILANSLAYNANFSPQSQTDRASNRQTNPYQINVQTHSRTNSSHGKRGIQLTPQQYYNPSDNKQSRSMSSFVNPSNQNKFQNKNNLLTSKQPQKGRVSQNNKFTYSDARVGSSYGAHFDYIQSPRSKKHSFNNTIFNHTFNQSKNSFMQREMATDNYDSVWSHFNVNDKELFMRFCRCALKRKDIIYKENQFQIGLITEASVVKGNKIKQNLAKKLYQTTEFWRATPEQDIRRISKQSNYTQNFSQKNSGIMMRFLLHFTNIGDDQIQSVYIHIQNIPTSIDCYIQNNNPSATYHNHIQKQKHSQQSQQQVGQNFIYCIQPSQQQKIALVFHSNEPLPYIAKPCVIKICYRKKMQSFSKELVLPMLSIKMIDYQKPQGSQLAALPLLGDYRFKFSKRMLPKISAICSYFQQMQQKVADKLYEVDGRYPSIQLQFRLRIEFSGSQSDKKINLMRVMLQDMRASKDKSHSKLSQKMKNTTNFKGNLGQQSPQWVISNQNGRHEIESPLSVQQHYIVSELLAFIEFAFSK